MKKNELIEKIKKMKFKFKENEKKEFLLKDIDKRPIKTVEFYIAGIKYLNKAEEDNGREWEDFTPTMLNDALYDMNATSLNSLQAITTVIKDYLQDTTVQTIDAKDGYINTIELNGDTLKQYVDVAGQELRYITHEEFDDIIFNQAGDPMGKSIFILLYHGVKGTGFKDIYELKVKDINFNTGEVYRDKKLLAVIPMKYMDIMKEATEEENFIVYDKNGNIEKEKQLTSPTGFFIRRVKWGVRMYQNPDRTLIARLIKDYCQSINNNYVDGQSVYNSGDVYRLIEHCGMKMPTNKQWREWKEITGSTLSYATTFTAAEIILKKLGLLDKTEVIG